MTEQLAHFTRDTAVRPLGEGRFAVEVSPDWSAPTGPNGGYVSAIVTRAMEAAVGDPARQARSLTCHFLRPPQPGPAEVETTIERAGRNLTTVSARIVQGGKPCTMAIGAFAQAFRGPVELLREVPAGIRRPHELKAFTPREDASPIAFRFEMRGAVGDRPFTKADRALSGGWMALKEAAPLDAPLVACLTDAWLPPVFNVTDGPVMVPTVDLTIHFRARLPLEHQPVLGIFGSRHAQDGFVEEDGTLWLEDGTLLAHSRQLSVLP